MIRRAVDQTAASAAALVSAMVAAAFNVGNDHLQGPERGSADVALARQVAIYLIHTRLGTSLALTGAMFGRDRTTAAHACRAIEERREDPVLDGIIALLERASVVCAPVVFA